MEFQFQMQENEIFPPTKHTTSTNEKSIRTKKTKFVGVRQRPSGKWVAEIKNTTQKIRMWLGTFDTAEAAARAYDEAACLLRGSNTRTNFGDHIPSDSALSLKIKNLLNQKKGLKQNSTAISHSTKSTSSSSTSNCLKQDVKVFGDTYKPDLSNCFGGFEMGSSYFDHSLGFRSEFDVATSEVQNNIPDFEHMKVERQISASLYAMNGVNEYWENVHDCHDASWDLPMLYQMFSLSLSLSLSLYKIFCILRVPRAMST